jgi:hypothetical protein
VYDYSKLKGSFDSNCGISFTFSLDKEDEMSHYSQLTAYSVIVTILALSQIFNSIWLNCKVESYPSFANSISLITIVENMIWNSYGCLSHFFFTINLDVNIIYLYNYIEIHVSFWYTSIFIFYQLCNF